MAYTEKYFLSFCNPLGQSCRVSILEDDFIGVSTELVGQSDPVTIAWDNSDDFKFKAIIESEMSINLVFNDDTLSLSELWTSNERTFKVEYTINNNLEWAGFIIPEGFDYNLKGGSYEAVLTARDGLATLEGILFKTDNNQFYGFQDFGYNNGVEFPFILVLTEILRKLDLGIDIWTLVDYYEQTMLLLNEDSRNSDPLAISYVNVKTYINDTDREDIAYFEDVNEAWDCKKIIENICNIWGARLYQQSGVWRLKSIHADSVIANPYNTENDPFVGENPVQVGYNWEYEAYYSINRDINLDTTVNFYSFYNTVNINDTIYEEIPNTTSDAGFYLIKGVDKLIEVNALGIVVNVSVYEPAVENYYWKKYNNTAGYLGRELANTGSVILCSNKDIYLKDNDATVRMDQVYKQFRVNFDYTFLRVGDSPINFLKNGDFQLPFEQYGQLEAPPEWERHRDTSGIWYPRGRVYDLPAQDIEDTEGQTKALEISRQYNNENTPGTDPNPAVWAAYLQKDILIDQKVRAFTFSGWAKYKYKGNNSFDNDRLYFPVFKCILYPEPPVINAGKMQLYALVNAVHDDYDLQWIPIEQFPINGWPLGQKNRKALRKFFQTNPIMGNNWVDSEKFDNKWYDFNLRIQVPPKLGTMDFYIHGLCANTGRISESFPDFQSKGILGDKAFDYGFPTVSNQNQVPTPLFTGLNLGYIPDPDTEIPKTDYIYANGDVDYTFQEDPIRVYNGDTVDNEIISGIIVPNNLSGLKNKWDTFNNAFGKSDIGMIFCKSIMQQYYKPNRLLDCDFKLDTYKYGDIIELEHIPNVKFIMLRGTKNEKRGWWEDCTLAQISNDYISPGGITNGNTLDPKWQETGNTRCVKDLSGLNTGISEYETQDVNTNSDSFGNFRWQSGGENLTLCPIGQPSKYYWGTDVDDYDLINFKDYNIVYENESIGQVQVSYSNSEGNYIYFLHLASLGSVVQIGNPYQSQIISSFTYIDDVTINGYLYRVLRQDFVTSEFENFLLTYYIQ